MLENSDLTILTNIAIQAAQKAGERISEQAGKQIAVQYKTGGTSLASQVVTEIDGLSQEIILQTLKPLTDTYDLGLLTEEQADDKSRCEKEFFWCIDPLDGTLPFIEQKHGYAVSIALISKK